MTPTRPLLLALGLLASAACSAQPAPVLSIGQVQGPEDASPYAGQPVRVQGVVTATFPGLGLFALQDAGDRDPATSDGVFVAMAADARVSPGQRLAVTGTVAERDARNGTLTVLEQPRIDVLGAAGVPAVRVTAPPVSWERYEGMRVRIGPTLVLAGHNRLDRDGEVIAAFGERPWTPTEVALPGEEAGRLRIENARRMLRLDDGRDAAPEGAVWYLPPGLPPRTGSTLARVEGVIDQRNGFHRLQLVAPPRVTPAKRPAAPKVRGDVRIAAFNLENLFNGDGRGGGFPTPRGAKTPQALQAQVARHVVTLRALDADIVALMELENDGHGPEAAVSQLLEALNAGGGDWRAIDTGPTLGTDQIRVGIIYRASRVQPVGAFATLTEGPFGAGSRVPLAQSFRAGDGPVFTVVANHFKSKGCGNAAGADLDQRDGQSCFNAMRTDSARRLHAWLATDPTRSGSPHAVVLGDLNAYAKEDPVRALLDAGWRDAFALAGVRAPYSYVFDAQRGRLDHGLVSPSLAARVVDAAEWHANADEPSAAGYEFADPAAPASPWASSDHDPLVIGLRLRAP